MTGSRLQWSFPNINAASSQILSFKSAQEELGSHKLSSPGFSQRNLPLNKQLGSQYSITGYRWQHNDVTSVSNAPEGRIFPATGQTNQMVSAAVTSVLPSHWAPCTTNVVSCAMGGVSAMSTVSVPPRNCPVVGSTDLKSSLCISTGPCQLTIFYNGSVCVYDNVSPGKAQAIMLLAGNGDSTNSSAPAATVSSAPKVQLPALRLPANDTATPNQSVGFSSSISVPTSITSLPAVASSCAVEVNAVNSVVASAHIRCPQPLKSSTPGGAGGAKFIPSAVPQARKASLARFLEKRKERVICASPYAVRKNSSKCSAIGSGGATFAANSASSSPLPASN